jgi:hypothetical protein
MSMRDVMRVVLVTVAVALGGCKDGATHEEHPPTGVDLDRPVSDLEGWDELLSDLGATEAQARLLAGWIAVFREGLDLARRADTSIQRAAQEASWWLEASHSLAVIVGADQAPRVEAWLHARYGREGEPP